MNASTPEYVSIFGPSPCTDPKSIAYGLTAKKCGMPIECAEAVGDAIHKLARDEELYAKAVAIFAEEEMMLDLDDPVDDDDPDFDWDYFNDCTFNDNDDNEDDDDPGFDWDPLHPWGYSEFDLVHVDGQDDDDDDDEEDFAPRPSVPRIDPEEFVGKLTVVDISTIPKDDMKCLYCWNMFGETDDNKVELRSGERDADNSPVKMPCGHLIGKTCLMQLIDADDHLCPLCRVDIVALGMWNGWGQ